MTTSGSPRLVAVGDNCLDVYLTKDLMAVGGNALNVAVHWRRNGWAARYLGAVGDDAEGAVILNEIENAGLSPADLDRRPGDTAVTLLRDESGDRKFLLEDLGVGADYRPTEQRYGEIRGADWVHLGTNANPDLVRRLAADHAPFSIDVSTRHLALPLTGVPLLFASSPDGAAEPVELLIETLRRAGARQVVVTCGARGAFFSDGGALLHVPATPVQVVDTCGAGDSFIASFLIAFCCERRDAGEALRKAAAAAAETCTHIGGFPQQPRSIPDWLIKKYAAFIAPAAGR
ncbi:MAG TPA: PfkB family carbohydrate kinase [Dongiaceae bacterium]|jgi:fructoselysine 6-kinase|nr:PfkB family carbohydrate kinase [Dongiaceae bacterium]